jgi:hypothetical protein
MLSARALGGAQAAAVRVTDTTDKPAFAAARGAASTQQLGGIRTGEGPSQCGRAAQWGASTSIRDLPCRPLDHSPDSSLLACGDEVRSLRWATGP